MKSYLGLIVVVCLIRPAAAAPVEPSPEVLASWADDYAGLKAAMASRNNHYALLKEGEDRKDVASIQSLIWDSDKTPADVAIRRIEALLKHLKTLPRASDLAALEQRLAGVRSKRAGGADDKELYMAVRGIGRAAVFANPLMDFDQLIFNRWTSSYGHVQEAWASSVRREGGLYVLSGLKTGRVTIRNVLENARFENGPYQGKRFLEVSRAVRSFDLSSDAKKVVFAWVQPSPRALKIASVNVDGADLRQLTDGEFDDLDPVWLPNGRIVFISTRIKLTVRCNFGPKTPQGVMHSMKADGSDLVRISFHETNERYPSVDNDGRLIYMRWDYIDRDFSAAHHLWVCNPDGRDPRSPHGNYPEPNLCGDNPRDGRGDRPFAEYFMRAVPGSSKYMAIASTHHAPPYGIPILIDPTVRDDNKVSQVKVIVPQGLPFPSECGRYTNRGLYQGISFVPIKQDCAYFDPWPLSETFYLVPWGPIEGDRRGGLQESLTKVPMELYLLDAFGNRELLSDCNLAAGGYYLTARPLRPTPAPPVIPTATFQGERAGQPDHKRATLFVVDARRADRPWPPGVTIKRMRIVQVFPRPWSSGNVEKPFTGWSEGGICRASLGTVPIEEDGSVYCEAPVNKALLFQLLDEKGMAVQTMRSLTYVHPGEQLSCVGCHEDKWEAVRPPAAVPLALRRPPSPLEPEAGGPAPMTFGLVRPIFERSCIPCHKEKGEPPLNFEYNLPAPTHPDPKGKSKLSDYCYWFDASNNNDGVGPYGGYRSTPLKFGFANSRMGKALLATHGPWVKPEDLHRIMLWLDLNAMRLGTPTLDPAEVRAQETGEGTFIWPPEMDPANPTGVERDRPVPGPPK
jgi:Hydrazine synthase alpha subunit middle domain/WD40-like Beta Propeller Repeat